MPNVLTITPYKEFSNRGQKSFNFIDALSGVKNVRTINVHHSLKSKCNEDLHIPVDDSKVDVCVMHIDPHHFVKTKYPSIGVFEPKTIGNHEKSIYTQFLDVLAVYSNKQKEICKSYNDNIKVIRPSINLEGVLSRMKSIQTTLKFYVPSVEKTSNISLVIKSYFKAFTAGDNVMLGILSENSQRDIQLFESIKDECGLRPKDEYPEIVLYNNMKDIQNDCHCCIDVDSTYEINTATLLATKFGNPIVCLNTSSIQEWLPDEISYKVSSYEDFVFGSNKQYIYDREVWQKFSLLELSNVMREIYEDRLTFRGKQDKVVSEYHSMFHPSNSISSMENLLCF